MKNSGNPQISNSSSRYGFEMIFREDGNYYFQFRDMSGEPLLFSKGYTTEKDCADGVRAVIRAARADERYDLQETKKGEYFFSLKAGDGSELGRSRIFETLEELEEQMDFLKGIDEDVPQYDVTETSQKRIERSLEGKSMRAPSEAKNKVLHEKVKKAEKAVASIKKPEVTVEKPSRQENAQQMPAYKFSVFYHPDQRTWTVKNDISGVSAKMKTCDGQQIETFIKSQVPVEELESFSADIKQEATAKKKSIVVPKPHIPAVEEVELTIRTQQGELVQGFAKADNIGKVELCPKAGDKAAFDARVMARSLTDNQTVVIGVIKKQSLVNGLLEVPVFGGYKLKTGLYRFSADVNRIEQEGNTSAYYGSKLVVLN